ncbi:MAG: sensor histidine kinase [Oscillospiraceae bacterium]
MKNKFMRLLQWSTSCGKLRNKLLCIYFLLIVIPLGMFSLYSYLRVKSVIQEQTFSAAQNAFDDTCLSLEHLLGRLDGVIDILSTDPLIYTMASNDRQDFTYIRRLEDSDQLATTFEHLRVLSGVDHMQLYVSNDYPYSNTQTNIIQISQIEQSGWYQAASNGSLRLWCAPGDLAGPGETEQQCFSSVQIVYNPRSVKEPLAILRADIDTSRVQELVSGTSITENGLLLLLRGDEVLLASDTDIPVSELGTLVEQLHRSHSGEWQAIQAGRTDYYVQTKGIGPSGWSIASILPYHDVYRLSHELSVEMLFIVIIVALAAYLLAYLISQSTLNRVSKLTDTMQAVENGNVTVRLNPCGNDEIAQMMDGFNLMMDRVDTLMEERVEYGRQIKNLELKALQAQINPHFLYNSLDLINCTAITRNVPEISRMVNALGRFYRLSLSKGREVIPLSDEIKHAQLYAEIQNMRFENHVDVHWNLDPSAANCQIIKIVLQPLIENAIIHGIFEKPSKCGCLTVSVRREPDGIRITIEDDGIGMDEATRLSNFSPTAPGQITATPGGYGVRNIQDRLRLAYGEPFGLHCVSRVGEGTTVTVYIPAIEPNEQPTED